HLALGLAQEDEIGQPGADLLEQAALSPVAPADAPLPAQRMPQQHQASQSDALESLPQNEAIGESAPDVLLEGVHAKQSAEVVRHQLLAAADVEGQSQVGDQAERWSGFRLSLRQPHGEDACECIVPLAIEGRVQIVSRQGLRWDNLDQKRCRIGYLAQGLLA